MNTTTDDHLSERAFISERLTYELAGLERFIAKDISSIIDPRCSVDDELFLDWKQAFNERIEEVKNNFINAVFGFEEERYLEHYIQYHQCALIRLAGNLLKYVKPESLGEVSSSVTPEVFCQYTYKSLQELLDFIEKHFSKYFDQNAWIPLNYRRIMSHDITTNIDSLKKVLTTKGADDHLIHIALLPLENFLKEDTSNEVTYRRVIYLKELKKQLLQLNSNGDRTDINESVRLLLFYLNFNSTEFYDHCIQQLKDICENSETDAKCIDELALYQKSLYQIQQKPGFALHPSLPFLREQLVQWIDREITYLEGKRNREKDAMEHGDVIGGDFKIKVALSVAQFAYFIKLLFEVKVIQNRNVVQLLRFLSKFIKTEHAEEISPGSLKNSFYSTESSAREVVKGVLQKMIDYINNNKGTP